jgi:exopolysaccharide production protein ExoZ
MNAVEELARQDGLKSSHIVTIDFARGLMAAAVMIYHFLSREAIAEFSQVSYYAVYTFFAISGFSLYIAYCHRLSTIADVKGYFIRRFFRIAPVFYVALLVRLLIVQPIPDATYNIFMNFTFLFGFSNPGATSLLTGGWSIGVEVVFYLLFPIVLLLTRRRILPLTVCTGAAILVMVHLVNATLTGQRVMTAQLWSDYTQPESFGGYFMFGMLLGELYLRMPQWKGHSVAFILAAVALLPFVLVSSSTPEDLLTSWTGGILMISTLLFTGATSFIREPRGKLLSIATWFGILSFPVYLLHPLVHHALLRLGVQPVAIRLFLAFGLTILLSYLIHHALEKPARDYGRQLTALMLKQ